MQTQKTAIIFGATGLIGSYLLNELVNHSNYSQIKIFTRKPVQSRFKKVEEIIIDFKSEVELTTLMKGDEVFCCLGTTIKKAGSQEAFRKVDYELPVLIGEIAVKNKITRMLVVSSLGADAGSSNFYLRTKGEMEAALTSMNFSALKFFRPSMLLGPRSESRPGETIGKVLMTAFDWALFGKLRKYKAIHAQTVAKAMVYAANSETAGNIFESDVIEKMGSY